MNRLSVAPWLLVLACSIVGCGGGRPGAPPLAKVSGTVTLDGAPMGGGEVRFTAPEQPTKSLPIKDGAFSGEVFVGKNRVDVVWDVDGPPNPMDPKTPIPVNKVAPGYSGPNSPLSADVDAKGTKDLKFDVRSGR